MRRPASSPRPSRPPDGPGRALPSGGARALARALEGWRGPLLAGLLAALAALPGLWALPPSTATKRARRWRRRPRPASRPPAPPPRAGRRAGPHGPGPAGGGGGRPMAGGGALRLSAALSPTGEARDVRALRWPSLLGAVLAAAACAWGGAGLLGPVRGAAAGALLAVSPLLSFAGAVAGRDALLCGGVTLALAGLARCYALAEGLIACAPGARTALWAGTALAVCDAGAARAVAIPLALLALLAADRRAAWMRGLGWTWGLLLVLATAGPWMLAAAVAADGGIWASPPPPPRAAFDPPGLHAALLPVLLFPATLLPPAAAVRAWRGRNEPGCGWPWLGSCPGGRCWSSRRAGSRATPCRSTAPWLGCAPPFWAHRGASGR